MKTGRKEEIRAALGMAGHVEQQGKWVKVRPSQRQAGRQAGRGKANKAWVKQAGTGRRSLHCPRGAVQCRACCTANWECKQNLATLPPSLPTHAVLFGSGAVHSPAIQYARLQGTTAVLDQAVVPAGREAVHRAVHRAVHQAVHSVVHNLNWDLCCEAAQALWRCKLLLLLLQTVARAPQRCRPGLFSDNIEPNTLSLKDSRKQDCSVTCSLLPADEAASLPWTPTARGAPADNKGHSAGQVNWPSGGFEVSTRTESQHSTTPAPAHLPLCQCRLPPTLE
jgi:hypothetical protein